MAVLRKQRLIIVLVAAGSVMGFLTTVKGFVTSTWPWMVATASPAASWFADWGPIIVAGAASGALVYFWLQYGRYRDALRKVTRDYIVDVADLNTKIDPDNFGPMSAEVKRGEATADIPWGNRIIGKYDLPPEDEYR